TLFVFLATTSRSHAEGFQRIRTTSSLIHSVLVDASEKSPTLRSIVQRVAESNVIVHLTCEQFKTVMINGRTIWVEANGAARYLRVQVDCMLPQADLAAILGHELQHVAEVADRPEVNDSRSFVKLFQTIGFSTCGNRAMEQFETDDATKAGRRVRGEFLHRWPVGARLVTDSRRGVPVE
ncbi:MAG TPA: hypothetical protein VFP91_10640, partial [Vicinamibacterales bacterium]|nr:hypothetical protein [Vicinamibacterales bacterium]